MDLQILVLSKLIKDDGAFSLKKLINMGGAKVKGFDKTGLMEEFNYIHQEYVKKKLDSVRDQFIAHLDLSAEEIKIDIHTVCIAKNQIASLYNRISFALDGEEYHHDDRCVKGIESVFEELDEYEKVKAVIVAAQVKGKSHIDVSEFLAIKS
jgi:predicted nuclease of restriction endonuclease-like RecB superfamily